MAVNLYEQHRPREASITVSLAPDFSGDYVAPGAADDVTCNAAITEVVGLGGGEVVLGYGDWQFTATVNVPANVFLRGIGWETVLNYNAGGNCVTITGDNVKLRDFKVVIVAGAGGAGTRPNGVYATGRTNVEITNLWLVGDETEDYDGSDLRQNGILFNINTTYSKIAFCTIQDFENHGINFEGTFENEPSYIEIEGNISYSNINYGIRLRYSLHCAVTGNITEFNGDNGIGLSRSHHCTITGNVSEENTSFHGIYLSTSCSNTLAGNTCQSNGNDGIGIESTSDSNTITGNNCSENLRQGIKISQSNGNTIVGNISYQNYRNGIWVERSSNNTIVGNTCNENDYGNTATYDGICIEDDCDYNLVHSNTCNENDRWGISIGIAADDCVENWVKNNHLRGNTSGPFSDQGTNTKLATIPLYIVTYNTDSESEDGPTVDGAGEWVSFVGQLPLEVQQVLKIEIWAVTNQTDADQMLLEIEVEGGADNEPKTTHDTGALANQQSVTTNFTAEDIIHWECTDAAVLALLGGDSVKCVARFNALSAPDIATDADFRRALVHVV